MYVKYPACLIDSQYSIKDCLKEHIQNLAGREMLTHSSSILFTEHHNKNLCHALLCPADTL